MGQFAWVEPVANLRTMLNTLEAQVGRGHLGASGLEEFKAALDELRLRGWSLLTAGSADDPHGFQEQFRTHRGTELCRALSTDLRTGKLFDAIVDFDAATLDPETGGIKAEYVPDSTAGQSGANFAGDKLHPNRAGYVAMGMAVDLAILKAKGAGVAAR